MKIYLKPTLLTASILASSCVTASEVQTPPAEEDLFELSLEELISMDIPDVTSVSRKKQSLTDSAAAIYVITQEDIRRSGITSIPDALRMVPGMQVAKLNSNTWSISTRGFNYIFANKLLVLIDGRTVYSPLFSGVNWDVQDTLMEDIDRIEVIRGPGAALWGANAVNGVINVITKDAAETQGSLLSVGGGTEERAFAAYRYGGEFGESGYYRAYVKAFERDGQATDKNDNTRQSIDAEDDWHMQRTGFRAEWESGSDSQWTLQGDLYEGTTHPPLRLFNSDQPEQGVVIEHGHDRDQRGGNIGLYWKKTVDEDEDYSFRMLYDNYQNFDYRITEKRDTLDFEFQHYAKRFDNHHLVWGLGYRSTWYDVDGTEYMYLTDGRNSEEEQLFSAFIQDDIVLSDLWTFTLSSRLEHNDYSGFELQPNMRLTWKPRENRTFWSALSYAVKTPSLSETSLQTDGVTINRDDGVDYVLPIEGNPDLKSEKLLALEFGYREQFTDTFRIDATTFLNQYRDIIAYVNTSTCPDGSAATLMPNGLYMCPTPAGTPADIVQLPTTLINGLDVTSYGLELVADWQLREWWKLQFTYSWLQTDAGIAAASSSFLKSNERIVETLSAPHTANIRSSMNLPNRWYLDLWVRYMDELENAGLDENTSFDLRLAKQLDDDLELSFVGQNLFSEPRKEFFESLSGFAPTEIEESWYVQIRWQF